MIFNWIRLVLNYKVKHKKEYQKKTYEEINFNLLKNLSDHHPLREGSIDDITWHDLELNKVFCKLNRTHTLSGEEMLYSWMKTPTQNSKEFQERMDKLNHVDHRNQELIKDFQAVGSHDQDYREEILKTKARDKRNYKPAMIYGLILLNIQLFALTNISIFFFGTCCGLGLLILFHYFYVMNHKYKLATFDYIVRASKFYKKNIKLIEAMYSESYNLNNISPLMDQLHAYKKTFSRVDGANPIEDIAVVLTLTTYRKAASMDDLVANNKEDILDVFKIMGEIDLCQSIQQFKEDPMVCKPELSDDLKDLMMKDSTNILIDDCVENNLEIHNSMVITGSNMGGKSSILRQIGINTVLAQAFGMGLARAYKGGFFRVVSAISLKDDIESGKSYFLKEAEAIHRMLYQKKNKTLILIDEIFKGTNPIERLAASVEILNRLAKDNLVIVTTHDIGILPDLINFEFYHFEPKISKSSMTFDYKIKKGITEVRNAVKLMEYIEYPEDLIKSINQKIIEMNAIV